MDSVQIGNKKAYEFEDIAFANTNQFLEAAKTYEKYGFYTDAHPESTEFKEFWDREEDRLINGMIVPGKLMFDEYGAPFMQEVHITGEHYGYLNYGRIKLTDEDILKDVAYGNGDELILDVGAGKARRKKVAFPSFWDGDYHYFKAKELARRLGLHIVVAKARRKGYTYKNAYGAAHNTNMHPDITTILGAYEKKYLLQGDAITTFAKNYLDWFETETDFTRHYISEAIDNLELGYFKQGTRIKKGYRSKLLTLTFKDNPNAAVGKDGDLIILEEAGVFPNLMETLGVTLPTLEDGDYTTGQMIVFGTGGTKEANWIEFERLFYNPSLFGFMSFHNVWDEDAQGTSCGFFHSYDMNYVPYIDKDGNSMFREAKEAIMKARRIKKDSTTNLSDYLRWIGQRCVNPREAFSSSKVSIFDSPELRKHIHSVKVRNEFKYLHREGKLKAVKDTYDLIVKEQLNPSEVHEYVNQYQLGDIGDLHGTFVEWFPPYKLPDGSVPGGLYRIWVDPYAFRKEKEDITLKDSLGAMYVYERVNNLTNTGGDRLVACFVGRPEDYDDFNEVILRASIRYNAEVMFENDRGTVEDYFRHQGHWDRLADEPMFNWSKELKGTTSRKKGMSMGAGSERKSKAAMMLKNWLYEKRTKFDNGDPVYNFHYIYDLGLLQELQKWNLNGNFDRVSALLVGILDKNELINVEIDIAEQEATDSFWKRELY